MKTKSPIALIFIISLLLFACNTSRYKHFENTKWTGLYAKSSPLSLIIDKVDGDTFEGELHWPKGKQISYVKGTFSGDSIDFEEVDMVYGRNLVLNGTYPAVLASDTIKGAWMHKTHDWSGTEYYAVKDNDFKGKTNDQKILSSVFHKTKEIEKQLDEILPTGKNPYRDLNDSLKHLYVNFKREIRDISISQYEKLEDEEIKKSSLDQVFYETISLWRLAHNPVDSVIIMNEINKAKEGEDGYYRKQRIKVQMSDNPQNAYKEFISSMLDKALSTKDQISLLFSMLYELDKYPEFEPIFKQRYKELKEKSVEHEMLVQLDRVYNSMLVSQKLKPGAMAPAFEVETLKGDKIKLADYKGKFVFIDFWGSWCGPCKGEIPHIKKLTQNIPNTKLQVLGLANDKLDALTKYIKDAEIEYPNAIANKELLGAYGISAFPTTFLINPTGKIVAKNLRGEKLTELIKEHMK